MISWKHRLRVGVVAVVASGLIRSSAWADDDASAQQVFTGAMTVEGWSAEKGTSLSVAQEHLELRSTQPTARIWRSVTLPAGRLILSGTGTPNVRLILKDATTKAPITTCDLDYGEGAMRTNWSDFETTGGTFLLSIEAEVSPTSGKVAAVTIEKEPLAQGAMIPDPQALAQERPSPWPGRGFMMGSLNDKSLADARAMGANIIRIQLNPTRRAKELNKDLWDAWPQIVEEVADEVRRAGNAGLKVVLDMHTPPVPGVKTDQNPLWVSPELDTDFCKAWHDLAVRLLPLKANIWAYDIYNEPLDRTQLPWPPKQWYPLALKILQTIRAVDPDVWIVYEVGPGSMFRGFNGIAPLPDTHVVYGAHFYAPGEFTHQGIIDIAGTDLATAMTKINVHYPSQIAGERWDQARLEKAASSAEEFAKKWGVPIYIGEFSVIRWAPKDDAVHWLQDVIDLFEKNHWSYTYHAFREFPGWSVEHDETYWMPGMPQPAPSPVETERSKVLRKAFQLNWPSASDSPSK